MEWFTEYSTDVEQRRVIIPVKEIPVPTGQQYCSWVYHTESEGRVLYYAPYIIWDIDTLPELGETIVHALQTVRHLYKLLVDNGAPKKAIRVLFSGGKGFHLYLDSRVVGLQPDPALHRRLKSFCTTLLSTGRVIDSRTKQRREAKAANGYDSDWKYYPFVDSSLYQNRHIVGQPNSKHRRTGLYYRWLTTEELFGRKIELSGVVQGLATVPVRWAGKYKGIDSVPFLKRLWDKTEQAPTTDMAIPSKAKLESTVKTQFEQWHDCFLYGATEGDRNQSIFRLACGYRNLKLTIRECALLVWDANTRSKPPLDAGTVRGTINSAYKETGEQLAG